MLLKTLLEIVAETGSSTKFEEVVRIGSPALNHVGLLLSPQQPLPPPGWPCSPQLSATLSLHTGSVGDGAVHEPLPGEGGSLCPGRVLAGAGIVGPEERTWATSAQCRTPNRHTPSGAKVSSQLLVSI